MYLDYAATKPIHKQALETFTYVTQQYWGNSQSLHEQGNRAKHLLENCRDWFASTLSVPRDGIYFTSGGSESNFLAVEGLIRQHKKTIVSTAFEHSSISNHLQKKEREGYNVISLQCEQHGIISLTHLEEELQKDVSIVIIQHVNSELGTIQPIEQIASLCQKYATPLHVDCVQSFAKYTLPFLSHSGITSFSVSAHKFGGPQGIGLLFVNPFASFQPLLPHITHERGMRAGTVNVAGVAAMTEAAIHSFNNEHSFTSHVTKVKDAFMHHMKATNSYITIWSPTHCSVPHILGFTQPYFEGQCITNELNRHSIYVSPGSACVAGSYDPIPALIHQGTTIEEAKSFVRLSFSEHTNVDDAPLFAKKLHAILQNKERVSFHI